MFGSQLQRAVLAMAASVGVVLAGTAPPVFADLTESQIDLAVRIVSPSAVTYPGVESRYELVVSNEGTATAEVVSVQAVTSGAWLETRGPASECSPGRGSGGMCTFRWLTPREVIRVPLVVQSPAELGPFVLNARVTPLGEVDRHPADNDASVTIDTAWQHGTGN
jgi:hypothetical protein